MMDMQLRDIKDGKQIVTYFKINGRQIELFYASVRNTDS